MGVPESGAQSEDGTMVVWVAGRLSAPLHLGKSVMFRLVEDQFVFPPRREAWENLEARPWVNARSKGSSVVGPGHQHPRNRDFSKSTFRFVSRRATWAESDRSGNSLVGKVGLRAWKGLAADSLSRHGPKGVPRHPYLVKVHQTGQSMALLSTPCFQLVEDGLDIPDT